MNLVEQAAKRLEALRRAGAGDNSATSEQQAQSGSVGAPDTIEHAVERLRASARDLLLPDRQDAPITEKGEAVGLNQAPRLGDETARSTSDAARDGRQAKQSRKVEINLDRLAAAGYLTPDRAESVMANELRRIKRPLINACHGKLATSIHNANRIMVTSSLPGEGKSFISLNLAISMAMERDSTVLLVDADTSRPSLSHLIGAANDLGLLDLLTRGDLDAADTLVRTNIDRLVFLPAGVQRPHATELLASEAMARLVEELASRYPDRILIFDAPPLLAASEPAVLAGHMGQIVVVVEARRTTQKALQQALNTIDSCPAVMTVLNKAATEDNSKYVYFG